MIAFPAEAVSATTSISDVPVASEAVVALSLWDALGLCLTIGLIFVFLTSLTRWAQLLWQGRRPFGDAAFIAPHPRVRPFWNPMDFVVLVGILFVSSIFLMSAFQSIGWIERRTPVPDVDPVVAPEPAVASQAADAEAEAPMISVPQIVSSSMATIVASLAMLLILQSRRHDAIERIGLTPRLTDVGLGLRASVLILPPTMLMMGLVSKLQEYSHPVLELLKAKEGVQPDLLSFGVLAVTTVVVAPIVEEFGFRGLLQGGLQSLADAVKSSPWREGETFAISHTDGPVSNETLSSTTEVAQGDPAVTRVLADELTTSEDPTWTPRAIWPIVVTSIVFAIAHWGHGLAPVALFFLSLGLGYLARQTGSLVPSMVVHMVLNGLTMTVTFLQLMAARS